MEDIKNLKTEKLLKEHSKIWKELVKTVPIHKLNTLLELERELSLREGYNIEF